MSLPSAPLPGQSASNGRSINGVGKACQSHMRSFKDGDDIWIEPWRAKAFPAVKDLIVDRSAFDRIIQLAGSSRH